MKVKINSLIFIILISFGCTSKKPNDNYNHPSGYIYKIMHQIGNQIDYSLSEENRNVSEIRVWVNPELTNPKTLVQIKEIDSITYIKWSYYNYSRDNKQHYTLDSLKLYNRESSLKIDSLINKLNYLGFDKVQSQPDSINELIADGITYAIEVKRGKYYKAIDCNAPQLFDDENNKKLTEILKYLSLTMGFYFNEKAL